MTTVYITRLDKPAALYRHFQNEDEPQQPYLELDCTDGELTCKYDPLVGNAMDPVHAHRLILRAEIACLTADAANELMESLVALAQTVVDGFEKDWNGNNHVGQFTPEAEQAWAEICRLAAASNFEDIQCVEAYRDLGEWYLSGARHACQELGITAATTDEKLAEIARAEAESARHSGQAGYTILDPEAVQWYLSREREEMRNERRERLGEVSQQIADLTSERDALIGEVRGWGDKVTDSLRLIGQRALMSHSEVRRTLTESGSERVLCSSSRRSLYEAGRDNAAIERYEDAVKGGSIVRRSQTTYEYDEKDWAGVVEYTDPVDGSTRFAVVDEQTNGEYELADYVIRDVAERRYESLVRSKARMGFTYKQTDVEG